MKNDIDKLKRGENDNLNDVGTRGKSSFEDAFVCGVRSLVGLYSKEHYQIK